MHQPVHEESIKIIRMITGEDVVGAILHSDDSSYTIEKPFRIGYTLDPSGTKMGITLYPWMFKELCLNQNFIIKDRDVILTATPTPAVVNEYKMAIGREDSKGNAGLLVENYMADDEDFDSIDEEVQEALAPQQNPPKKETLH